ncbi:glycosyltransferase family 4 protein [Enterobacter cloacae]|uniref:glycosyltransferase family 4 protein n=1 Tax=Enterobacter cloacae TaxID=550 RepID=UPI00210A1A63|nr:glycosyltransferase family 4 protein [Enterobacter cloacae]MCQ4388138.1 glycosyltransferase family 4 protein [Enterobacter cloacae]HDC4570394.1 glycosyltransferase family 4 protein [Enterobacter cloacae]
MKIVIPVVGFSRSGGERVLARIATELIKFGHEVYLVAPDDGIEPYYPTSALVCRSIKEKRYNKYMNYFCTMRNLFKKCKSLEPDIVVANFHLTAYIAFLLPSAILKVYYIQAYEVIFSENKLRKLIAYLTYLLPLRKVVNSESLLPEKLNNYIAVVPAGVDTENFFPRKFLYSKKHIGFIGRKEKHKGTSQLIDIIIDWAAGKDITLNIGVYLAESDAYKLQKANINFIQIPINNDIELANFYRLNDLVLAVGLVEDGAFHYPCAEAMACGCLVISNYAPLANSNSLLKIDSFSRDSILEKLNLFFSLTNTQIDNELEIGNIIKSLYSWDKVGDKFNKTLLELKSYETHNDERHPN